MTRNFVTTLKGVLSAAALIACLSSSPARAQFEVVVSPPSDYLATTEPVYFEGHAAYWYGNRWYYRDGSAWRYYHDEPQYLHDYRGRGGPRQHFYGRGREGFRRR
jgi:hypothetical protein